MLNPLEDTEQKALCNYLRTKKLLFFSIPNGGTRNKKEAQTLKQTGLLKGASDLVILTDNKIIFLELKRRKGGYISREQKTFLEKVNKFDYAVGIVCYGYEDAIFQVEELTNVN